MHRRAALTAAATASAFLVLVLSPAPVHGQRGGQPVQLPDGARKALVETTCARCHALTPIPNSAGFSQPEWAGLIASMVALPKSEAGAAGSSA